ncbi:hypothetical protein EYF80_002098 [Liparis tanakae]|uniref:Uncharacterized protein n=1 Tax=Liparis tanakae TaxID=230148 RepID=A0A4Z2JCL1_9TELE|nr:hypothetical protein EYF80_002098 [Liparis tanakae]
MTSRRDPLFAFALRSHEDPGSLSLRSAPLLNHRNYFQRQPEHHAAASREYVKLAMSKSRAGCPGVPLLDSSQTKYELGVAAEDDSRSDGKLKEYMQMFWFAMTLFHFLPLRHGNSAIGIRQTSSHRLV